MRGIVALASVGGLLACGGDDPYGPPALEEDPAVEVGCATDRPGAGATRAKWVECDDELLPGRMAAGRVGDVLLENSRIRVIIRGPGDGLYLYGTTGGAVVDAAPHGASDLLQEIVPLLELNSGVFNEIVIVEAGDDGAAEIAVRGPAEPAPLFASGLGTPPTNVIVEQRYRLAPDDIAVAIETRVYSQPGTTTQVVGLIDALFLGGRVEPRFPGHVDGPVRGPFFASSGTGVSYGIVFDKQDAPAITLLELVFFELLQGPSIIVDGDSLTRHLVVGDGSMSSVVDRAWELYGESTRTVSGTTAPNVQVVARDSDGGIVTIARTADDGAYAFDVPAGSYTVTAESSGRSPGAPVSVDVGAADATANPVAGASGRIDVNVTVDGVDVAARIAVTGTGDSAGFERTGYSYPGIGPALVSVPPGTYTVDVSKGMEYDAFTATDVVVPPDDVAVIDAPLTRVLDTSGWIAVDPHMHSEMSIDSSVPLDQRLLSAAGEGVEVAISSDHDFVVDYAPVAAEMGLDGILATISGQESSSLIIGHVNAWPTPVDPNRPGGGAIPWYGNGSATVFELARAGDPDRIVQVNHPWHSLGLFTAIDFDRATLSATRSGEDLGIPGEDLDDFSFDALEVGNAKANESFEQVFGDWLALSSAGFGITATGASDSHGDDAYIGEARTYVYVGPGQDDPATIDAQILNDAIRDQHAVVAQGVFVTAGLVLPGGGASVPGDLVDLSGQTEATLRILVQAPPWLPTAAVVIYERETEIMRIPLDQADTAALRYEAEVALPIDADTLFVVAVEAAGDGSPVLPAPEPSFTNPLYVDADGDGSFASR